MRHNVWFCDSTPTGTPEALLWSDGDVRCTIRHGVDARFAVDLNEGELTVLTMLAHSLDDAMERAAELHDLFSERDLISTQH
jgi:hypothetical protein